MPTPAVLPQQTSLFPDLLEVSPEDARRINEERKAFVRRMAASAKEKPDRRSRAGFAMLKDMCEAVQLPFDGFDVDEMYKLTEEHYEVVHEGMLFYMLRSMTDTRLSDEKLDQIEEWIAEPLYTFIGDPEPFSFAACCLCAGLPAVNTEEFQDILLTVKLPEIRASRGMRQSNKHRHHA
jgi:hypothetical protein